MARRFVPIIVLAAAVTANVASAAEPTGDWLVEGGYAHVKIASCDDKLWGIVAWEQKQNGLDKNNPDPALRSRPTLGIPILLGMTPEQSNRWDGEIYNTQDGRTYTAHISLTGDDVLRVEGCVLGFLCGGQSWTRLAPPQPAPNAGRPNAGRPDAASTRQRTAGPSPRPTTPAQPTGPQPAYGTVNDVCAAVAAATGQPFEPRASGAGNSRSAR
jgi:uncharacterized protein (DUF2147 family)